MLIYTQAERNIFIQKSMSKTGNKLNVIILALNTQENAIRVKILKKSFFLTVLKAMNITNIMCQVACMFSKHFSGVTYTSHPNHSFQAKMSSLTSSIQYPDCPFTGNPISKFSPVTPDEVAKLLLSSFTKSSRQDFIPTSLIKSCSSVFQNSFLLSPIFPSPIEFSI